VQDTVDSAVAGAGESVALLVTGRCVQGCGAVPGCESALVREAADVADIAEQPCGTGRADAVQLSQAAAGGRNELTELGVGGGDPLVDHRQFVDQVAS
jgi:hypothetical protein